MSGGSPVCPFFAHRPSIDKLVESLQDGTKTYGVQLQSVSSEPHAGSVRNLGEIQVAFTLHGSYPNIKSAMAEALSRYPAAIVSHLKIRRESAVPLSEEATIQMLIPTQPADGLLDCRLMHYAYPSAEQVHRLPVSIGQDAR